MCVCVCVCVHVYVYMCMCVYVCICVCVYVHVHVYVHLHLHLHLYMYMYMYVYVYVCVRVCVSISPWILSSCTFDMSLYVCVSYIYVQSIGMMLTPNTENVKIFEASWTSEGCNFRNMRIWQVISHNWSPYYGKPANPWYQPNGLFSVYRIWNSAPFLAENSPIYPAIFTEDPPPDGNTMISGTCVQRSTLEAIFTSQGYSICSKTIPPEHTKKSK